MYGYGSQQLTIYMGDRLKTYLAARYSRWQEMRQVAERLEAMGHMITSRWVQGQHQCNDDQLLNSPEWAIKIANDDLEDLWKADQLILFTDPIRTATRGGKQVELGYAMALGLKIYIVGEPENVFQHLPHLTQVANVHFLYALLEPGYALPS